MVVFALIGIFLIKAAVDFNARDAVGLDGALTKLLHHSYGSWLLGVVSAGLIAFALYSLSGRPLSQDLTQPSTSSPGSGRAIARSASEMCGSRTRRWVSSRPRLPAFTSCSC